MAMRSREENSVPEWLENLLREKFFTPCSQHDQSFKKKNEKTFFCLSCLSSLCFSCLSSHSTHPLLQIRRYVYHEVIRLRDAEKLLNCSLVQPYTTNSAKVVFLKNRRWRKTMRGSSRNLCITCFRTLQYPYLFCSLSCKMNQQMNDNSLSQKKTAARVPITILPTAAAIKLVKDKRSCVKSLAAVLRRRRCFPVSSVATAVNRRKGIPQRSPLS